MYIMKTMNNVHKKEFRKQLLLKRKQKSQQCILINSEKISDHLLILPAFRNASHILFYVSYNGEVHTHKLMRKAFSLNKNVYVPISEPKTHTLTISKLNQFADLTTGSYSILEPKKEKREIVPIEKIETILVPGVAFDLNGNRLGQGGGYYDWLLSQSKATTIGLAFEFQIRHFIPTDPHDEQVDIIVTEKRIIHCNQ